MFKVGDKVFIEASIRGVDVDEYLIDRVSVSGADGEWVSESRVFQVTTSNQIDWQPVPSDRRFPEDGDYLGLWKHDIDHFNRIDKGDIIPDTITYIAKVSFNRPPQRVTESITCSPETMAKIKALLQEETCSK